MEEGLDIAEIAAAAARLARGDKPLEVEVEPAPERVARTEDGMVRLFIDAGSRAGVRPGDIVGAIANEAGVPGKAIGSIDIYDDFTFVELPRSSATRCCSGWPAPPSAAGRWRSASRPRKAAAPTSAAGIAGRRQDRPRRGGYRDQGRRR